MSSLASSDSHQYQAVLLDIEGTTTSIKFVADVLFPYARSKLREYLTAHWTEAETQADVQLFVAEMKSSNALPAEPLPSSPAFVDVLVPYIESQIDRNLKATPLKQLQGHMWRVGYAAGELKGDMYEDVKPCIESWVRRGYKVYIYSSGSIEAQKLIFGYSTVGDLCPLLSGYFDTTTGSKLEASSYTKIAQAIGLPTGKVVFFTDNINEAVAARDAGMGTFVSVRPGNAALPESHSFQTVYSFVDARL